MKDLFFERFQKRTTFIAIYLSITILLLVFAAHILLIGGIKSKMVGQLDIMALAFLLLTLFLLKKDFKKWYDFFILLDYIALVVLIDYIFLSGFNQYALIWLPPMAMSAFLLGGRKNGWFITIFLLLDTLALAYAADMPVRATASVLLAVAGSALLGVVIRKGFDEFEAENEEIRRRLYFDANIDPLTQLYNRRYFTQEAKKLLDFAKRKEEPLGVLTIDIDHFKKINDTYGHDFGDLILKKFAHSLIKSLRSYDLVARIGGEEFVVATIGERRPNLAAIAHKIKTEAAKIRYGDGKRLTVSIGIHSEVPDEESSLEEILKKSDEALYTAKQRGRNRVEFYEKKD